MDITPSGQTLGALITGIDLARPLANPDFRAILRALGEHGVLCFRNRRWTWISFPPSVAVSASWRSTSPTPTTSRTIPR